MNEMSTPDKEKLGALYRLVVIVALPIIGFFLIRLVNLVDATVDRQQKIEIILVGTSRDIDELKKFQNRSLDMFIDYFNRKDEEDRAKQNRNETKRQVPPL